MEDPSVPWDKPYDMLASFQAPSIKAVGEFNVCSDNPATTYQPLLSEAVSIAEARGLDAGALFFAMMAGVSAVIPNSIRLQVDPQRHPDWLESACIWTLLIAHPSAKKSLYHQLVTDPLNAYDDRLEHETADALEAFWSTPAKSRSSMPPPERRLLIDDVTSAKLQLLLKDNPNRLLLSSEEAANLIGLKSTNRSIYNKSYNGEAVRVDRKTTSSTKIRGAYLSMLISTHPDIMKIAAFEAAHDGYWQIFVPIQLTNHKDGDNELCGASSFAYPIIIDDILKINPDNPNIVTRIDDETTRFNVLRFSAEAQFAFSMYQYEINELAGIGVFMPNLGAHIRKTDKVVCRLAMIMHIIKHKPIQVHPKKIPFEIQIDDLKIAFEIVRYYIIPHLYSFYTTYFEDAHNPDVRSGAVEILSRKLGLFSASELKRPKNSAAAVKGLLAAGWIRPMAPYAKRYEVNPLVFSMIAQKHRDLIAQQMRRSELISQITLSAK